MNVALLTMVEEWGGCEVHTTQLARVLQARGHPTTIVCLTQRSYELYQSRCESSLPVIFRATPRHPGAMRLWHWWRFFSATPWTTSILVKGSFGVGDWRLDLAARLAFRHHLSIEHLEAERLNRRTRRHWGFLPGLGLWWRRQLLRGWLRSFGPRAIICVSDAVRRRLIEEFHFSPRKLVRVWNGIDAERFRPDPTARAALRERWGIPSTALVLGAAGRFAAMKGYDVALGGFQTALARFPEQDLRLVLVGQGELEQQLKAQAREIIPPGRVVFAPFTDRPWEVFAALDVFLMPSLTEGLPLALLEAMACACCPVATAAGGIPEILSEAGLGWLVPVGDADAFATAMVEAASQSSAAREMMGARARSHVQTNFEAQRQFNSLVDVIEQTSARSRPFRAFFGSKRTALRSTI